MDQNFARAPDGSLLLLGLAKPFNASAAVRPCQLSPGFDQVILYWALLARQIRTLIDNNPNERPVLQGQEEPRASRQIALSLHSLRSRRHTFSRSLSCLTQTAAATKIERSVLLHCMPWALRIIHEPGVAPEARTRNGVSGQGKVWVGRYISSYKSSLRCQADEGRNERARPP
jgi:hypothetical protein